MAPLTLAIASLTVAPVLSCTSVLFGPGATADGSVWVGQSDDGEGAGDARLVWVPAMDWPAGSKRPVFDYGDFPRIVDSERKVPAYFPTDKFNETAGKIGSIPQVAHTFGYYEADYAISNEHGLAFGESTVSAKIFTTPVSKGGPALLSMYELSRLGAERCRTASCAVDVMGALAEKYGFWGDDSVDTGGESLLVADLETQWIFHVLSADQHKGGAIWCAQKIPRDHAAVVSNAFVIGDVDEGSDDFRYAKSMHAIAKARGWWDGTGKLHFTKAFSAGEYSSHGYSGRRMWAFWSAVAPSLGVEPEYDVYTDAPGLTRGDLFDKIYRNYYKGTKYDLSAGAAAGPFGTPIRVKPGEGERAVAGSCGSDASPCETWERSIASFRSTNIHLTNLAPKASPVLWFLPYAAVAGVFLPVDVVFGPTPDALEGVDNRAPDRSKAFWAFRELAQFAYPRWRVVEPEIQALQKRLEGDVTVAADAVIAAVRELYDSLLVRDSDGWDYDAAARVANRVGYPAAWLDDIGYTKGTTYACKTTCP
ncbi:C69 peptidase-like protein [Aureococcus anophagefferens]|nr:C69 peptidase-like protein [Aureococcus anophagefferens]